MLPISSDQKLQSIPLATIAIIWINVILYILGFQHTEFLLNLFSHGSFGHIFGNMLFFWIFASYLENKFGWWRFLLYYFICYLGSEALFVLNTEGDGIGASGAISGIMGIYLIRCHYARINTLVPIGAVMFRVNINAKWLLLYWFGMDIYDAYFTVDNVGHWSHIGGFFTGILIGVINSYAVEGRREKLYDDAVADIDGRVRLDDAEDNLKKVLRMSPGDADAHYQLYRLYDLQSDGAKKARRHLLAAASACYTDKNRRSRAGELLREYVIRYNETVEPVTHLKYAHALYSVCDYSGAEALLEGFVGSGKIKGKLAERMFTLYISSALKEGNIYGATWALGIMKQEMPGAQNLMALGSAVAKYKPVKRMTSAAVVSEQDDDHWYQRAYHTVGDLMVDPIFTISLFISMYVCMWFFGAYGIAASIIVAFVSTYLVNNLSDIIGNLFQGGHRMDQGEALRQFDITINMQKAITNIKNERYEEARQQLLAVVGHDKGNVEAHYQLAKLLHRKLDDRKGAIRHYKTLQSLVTEGSIYHGEAEDGVRELLAKGAQTEGA